MTDKNDTHTCTATDPCITVSAGISAGTPEIEGYSATASINASETVCAENDERVEMIRRHTGAPARQGKQISTDGLGSGREL
ncbi:hypothetical protein [Pseudomonas fluorescens]|uniref:Uncharacterized protein n=1 Tax=Pseudomonas fluorescens TaxID=294 RepID=A0A5E7DFI7_PSEFL|nr:hypothetical protein [Pseudomonas fluorescens]VVO16219.1 hypothetical protein PS710_03867 [Pseudomonas fluorescens]